MLDSWATRGWTTSSRACLERYGTPGRSSHGIPLKIRCQNHRFASYCMFLPVWFWPLDIPEMLFFWLYNSPWHVFRQRHDRRNSFAMRWPGDMVMAQPLKSGFSPKWRSHVAMSAMQDMTVFAVVDLTYHFGTAHFLRTFKRTLNVILMTLEKTAGRRHRKKHPPTLEIMQFASRGVSVQALWIWCVQP